MARSLHTYRLFLKGQDFLDIHGAAATVQWLSVDLGGLPWPERVPAHVDWEHVEAVAILRVRAQDIEVVAREFDQLGFAHHRTFRRSVLVTKRVPVQRAASHFDLGEYSVLLADSEATPEWAALRSQRAHVVLGTLGIDRHQCGFAGKLLGGMQHALCVADCDSRRWNLLEPAMAYGMFTRMLPRPSWHHCCYVDPNRVAYADCRPIGSTACGAWVHCRFAFAVPSVPISLSLRHPVFKDQMEPRVKYAFATRLRVLLENAELIEVLRYISRRNLDSPTQPQWSATLVSRYKGDWDSVWALELAKRHPDASVHVMFNGLLLLHMAKSLRRV